MPFLLYIFEKSNKKLLTKVIVNILLRKHVLIDFSPFRLIYKHSKPKRLVAYFVLNCKLTKKKVLIYDNECVLFLSDGTFEISVTETSTNQTVATYLNTES